MVRTWMKTFAIVVAVVSFTAASQQGEPNDLSAYYGFGEMEIIKLDWQIGALRIADFNRDGRNDIAIANNRKARIELLIQKAGIEPAEAPVAVDPQDIDINAINPPSRFDKQPVAVSQKIYSLACGDLNSDGLPDLAYYGEPKGLYIILQRADGGAEDESAAGGAKLSWRTRKKISIEDALPAPSALVCADLNNDGLDDLAVASRDAIYTALQKNDGSLAEPVKYPCTAQPRGIEVADLDGDKINDLLIVTSDMEKPVHVRFGRPGGQLGPQVRLFCESPWALELYDIDNDGDHEILTVDAVSHRLICYSLVAETERDADWPILFYPLASGEGSADRDLVIGDFDGDGLEDVVISDPGAAELIFYRQKAGVGLAEPARFPAFADITTLSQADIDGDGQTELAVLSVKEKVIGISEFEGDRLSFPEPIDVSGEPVAMELADIDADGGVDCVYVSVDVNETRWLRVIHHVGVKQVAQNNLLTEKELELLGVSSREGAAVKLEKLTSNPDGLKVIDADQDGLCDVLIFDKYNPPPLFVRQAEKGRFELVDSRTAQSSLIKSATQSSIAIADVDQTGGEEVLIAQNNFARSLVFADSKSWRVIDQYNAKSKENNVSAVAAFRIGSMEPGEQPAILLLDGQKGQLQILKAGQDKTYRFEKELDVGRWTSASHLKMLYAPLTGSDSKSVLLFDSEKFAVVTPPEAHGRPRQLEQQFSYETKIKDGAYGHLAVGEINSDGRADIVMLEYKQNHIEILALDAEYKPVPAMRFKIFEQKSYRDRDKVPKSAVEPREMKIADVTGDGKDDLITVIHDRIIIYPQD